MSRQFGQLLSFLIAGLLLTVLVTGALSTHTSAQSNDAREAAFNKKADKILQGLRNHGANEIATRRTTSDFLCNATCRFVEVTLLDRKIIGQ